MGQIPGLTDKEVPSLRSPKKASKIRKLFKLTKEEDVVAYSKTLGHEIPKKSRTGIKKKSVRVQRLITPNRLQRKKARVNAKNKHLNISRAKAADYQQLLALRVKRQKNKIIFCKGKTE